MPRGKPAFSVIVLDPKATLDVCDGKHSGTLRAAVTIRAEGNYLHLCSRCAGNVRAMLNRTRLT